jgi:MEMO1 family protein
MNESRKNMMAVRKPAVAGLFYPAKPEELRKDIERLMRGVPAPPRKTPIKGIVAPHAGYLYSGLTAANAYARLAGAAYETVVVVSPSHKEAFEGVSVYPGTGYQTPLGTITIAEELRAQLIQECNSVVATEVGHHQEHAIEVHLPFLQWVLPTFKLLPLVIGHQSRETSFELGRALGRILRGKSALLVASTDLSH